MVSITDDDLAWLIMVYNSEYNEQDRVAAVNGVLSEKWFLELTPDEQQDTIKRMSIGIQTFNAHLKDDVEKEHDWKRLPDIEISGANNE